MGFQGKEKRAFTSFVIAALMRRLGRPSFSQPWKLRSTDFPRMGNQKTKNPHISVRVPVLFGLHLRVMQSYVLAIKPAAPTLSQSLASLWSYSLVLPPKPQTRLHSLLWFDESVKSLKIIPRWLPILRHGVSTPPRPSVSIPCKLPFGKFAPSMTLSATSEIYYLRLLPSFYWLLFSDLVLLL